MEKSGSSSSCTGQSFFEGLTNFQNYLDTLPTTSSFDGAKLVAIMDTFQEPFVHHFHHEISTIASFASLPNAPSADSPEASAAAATFKAWGKKTLTKAGMIDVVPFALLNLDRTFEDGIWTAWPPMPGPVRWMMVNMFGSWNWSWWKFASCDAQGNPKPLYAHKDHHIFSKLLEQVSTLTQQLKERDVKIENLTQTLKRLEESRRSFTCGCKRVSNYTDDKRNTPPAGMQEPLKYEEPINPLLPPHFSETWEWDWRYNDDFDWYKWADPFVVLAKKKTLEAALAADPLTSGLKIELYSVGDEMRPHGNLAFYAIFLQDQAYSKELDTRLHEMMDTCAVRWKVEKVEIRYLVWNDEIEDAISDDEQTEDLMETMIGDIRMKIFREAHDAGLFKSESEF
ncbi:unnamed protein product [Aureobasidium vineae]|uniref:Uncharacterized protein n=1 Tax=Aureobasidium vineae TaxID=2773715 RepID=A0A9N8P4Z0_9PEZI|nr:unnamed protein product [Aureobasidium vineae]